MSPSTTLKCQHPTFRRRFGLEARDFVIPGSTFCQDFAGVSGLLLRCDFLLSFFSWPHGRMVSARSDTWTLPWIYGLLELIIFTYLVHICK